MTTKHLWAALGAAAIAFHLWLIFSGLIPNLFSRPIHMAFALPWALIYAARTPAMKISGAILGALGLFASLWIATNESALSDQYGFLEGDFQTAHRHRPAGLGAGDGSPVHRMALANGCARSTGLRYLGAAYSR